MKKKPLIPFLVAVTVILILLITPRTYLSNTFTLDLVTDSTSSGGDRLATATLRYQRSKLVEGTATYIAHPGNTTGEISYTCTYIDNAWVNTRNTTSIPGLTPNNFISAYDTTVQQNADYLSDAIEHCRNLPVYPVTTNEVRAQIRNKQIVPKGETCGHSVTCYSVVE